MWLSTETSTYSHMRCSCCGKPNHRQLLVNNSEKTMLYSMHNYARIHFHLSLWPSALQIILATFSFTRSTAGHQLFKVAYFKVRLWTGNSLFGIRHMHTPASGTHAHRHACTQSHTHTRMHSHTHALTHTCTHTRIHARTHTHTHAHALTHTHARTHARTCLIRQSASTTSPVPWTRGTAGMRSGKET